MNGMTWGALFIYLFCLGTWRWGHYTQEGDIIVFGCWRDSDMGKCEVDISMYSMYSTYVLYLADTGKRGSRRSV